MPHDTYFEPGKLTVRVSCSPKAFLLDSVRPSKWMFAPFSVGRAVYMTVRWIGPFRHPQRKEHEACIRSGLRIVHSLRKYQLRGRSVG